MRRGGTLGWPPTSAASSHLVYHFDLSYKRAETNEQDNSDRILKYKMQRWHSADSSVKKYSSNS